ncbi:hypothetical protein OQA88_5477 [Cercophora sp. LCS_1]
MASSDQIVLFDIPTKPPQKAWSFNTWRSKHPLFPASPQTNDRSASPAPLQKPKLPHRMGLRSHTFVPLCLTQGWQLEYPDIRTRLEGHVPPNNTDTPYTVPTLLLPDGTYVTNNKDIYALIESRYPSPPLAYETPAFERFLPAVREMMSPLFAVYAPTVMFRLLDDASVPYFRRTREEDVGMTMEEYQATQGGEFAYKGMEKGLREITALLSENGGPFFGGEEVAHADFVWVGILVFLERLGEDVFGEIKARCGGWEVHEKLLGAVREREWLGRDD